MPHSGAKQQTPPTKLIIKGLQRFLVTDFHTQTKRRKSKKQCLLGEVPGDFAVT